MVENQALGPHEARASLVIYSSPVLSASPLLMPSTHETHNKSAY